MSKTQFLDLHFRLHTPNGEPNLIWAIDRYFNDISRDHKINDNTRACYIADYNNTICPCINPSLPIEKYDEGAIFDLKSFFDEKFTEQTYEGRFRHLIVDPILYYHSEFKKDDNSDWGAFYKTKDPYEGNYTAVSRIKRSFDYSEHKVLAENLLIDHKTDTGELLGIALTLYTAARFNESAALTFGDIKELKQHKKERVLKLAVKTTALHKNVLKLGGKTYNAPRLVPLLDFLYVFLKRRMNYLCSKLSFPIEDDNGKFETISDLPIACRGNNFTKRCSSDDLSVAAKNLFIKSGFKESRIATLSYMVFTDPDLYEFEKHATGYACRRDMATRYENAFAEIKNGDSFFQYCMGHKILNDRFSRNDFTDEYYLHIMKRYLEKSHPVNDIIKDQSFKKLLRQSTSSPKNELTITE